jgi:diguanylate cyclase (GGDEF)-like protein
MAADVEKLLERAKRSLEKNKPADAVAAYQSVLEIVPAHAEALQGLGDLYVRQNDAGKAAVYYGMLFDRMVEPREETKAAAVYSRFLRVTEQPPEREARYAMLLQRQNKTGEALEYYSVAAEHFLATNKEDEALKCLEQVAELDPEKPERHIVMAELAEKRGRGALAARGYVRAGQLALAAGEMQKAVTLLAGANRAAPEDRDAALIYGQALMIAGDAGRAATTLEPFASSTPAAGFQKCYGEALLRAGQLDRAHDVLTSYYKNFDGDHQMLFDLVDKYADAGKEAEAVGVLMEVREHYRDSANVNTFAMRLDKIAEAHPKSVGIIEFWSILYSGMNREARYFEVLVRLFDVYLENDNVPGACEVLDRMVDIDPYDWRNQQRMELLRDRAEAEYLTRIASRLGVTLSQNGMGATSLGEQPASEGSGTALDDLLVQAEIFLQYSLQPKAVERLQKISELFPGEFESNERLQNLCELANWWPASVTRKVPPAAESPAGPQMATIGAAPAGVYTAETMRDLARISEIGQNIYRQPTPRAMLTFTVSEVGKHLQTTRCLSVVGAPGQPPQLAAEFCASGVKAASAGQVMRLVAQMERAAPDAMGGLPLEAAAAPALREVGLATALGVVLMDKETQAPAGMIISGHKDEHRWKPNETYFLQAVGDQMLLGVSHTRLKSLVQNLNVADARTGLLARSAYSDRLLGETQRAKAQGGALSLAILQLDRGPELMRQQGEALVEKSLEQISRVVMPLVRPSDLAVKYTAWSLAFILPDTTLAGALGLVEQMRKAAGERNSNAGSEAAGPMTVSVGVVEAIARVDYDTEDIVTDLMNRAELSLEEAGKRGGDSVVSLTSSKT